MNSLGLGVIAAGFLIYGLVSARFQNSIVTPPMVFVAFGFAIGAGGFGVVHLEMSHKVIHVLAEITLVMVLFTDAARIDLKLLRRDHDLPVRMLAVGMPLTVLLGAGVALIVFGNLSIWEAALLAAILAPTDAALGQSVVSSPLVPVRIRQALNVESGLNDGIALPLVLLFASIASAAQDAPEATEWLTFGVLQVTLGPVVGAVVGIAGAKLIEASVARGWITESFEGLSALAIAAISFTAAEAVGGNGFIAAFVAGLCFGNTVKGECTFLYEFAETEGQLLTLFTFLLFGAAMLPMAIGGVDGAMVLFAVLSLTVIRMIPVAISLLGGGLRPPTLLFLSWFGPRGLASILFALLILEQSAVAHREEMLLITILTVLFSTVAHGLTAAPAARVYARMVEKMGECEESKPVSDMPVRLKMS